MRARGPGDQRQPLNTNGEVIFLGTGTSEGIPRVSCLTRDPVTCPVCQSAMEPGSPNRRRNTSVLLRYQHPDGHVRNVVIDVGKFFWHSAIDWFPKYQVPTIDAVVLTHAHADAAGGLDDLRDWTNNVQRAIPIYLRPQDMEIVAQMHFYLVNKNKATGGGGIAKLDFEELDGDPFNVEGLRFVPLPVKHGATYTAYGYRIGGFSYISDASEIPESTVRLVEGTEILVLDALRPVRRHRSHLTVEEAIEQVKRIRPEKAYFVDMTHDVDHESMNRALRRLQDSDGIDVELAYDGLKIPVSF